jgi:uncharacterized protein YjbJ (UPF0337 family)
MANEKTEEYKGRAKEAAGNLTDNEDLEREGKAEQASSTVKEKVGEATDKVKDAITSDDD